MKWKRTTTTTWATADQVGAHVGFEKLFCSSAVQLPWFLKVLLYNRFTTFYQVTLFWGSTYQSIDFFTVGHVFTCFFCILKHVSVDLKVFPLWNNIGWKTARFQVLAIWSSSLVSFFFGRFKKEAEIEESKRLVEAWGVEFS